MDFGQFIDVFEVLLAGRPGKGERDRSERHVEQAPPFGRCDVIFALRDRGRDNLDLAVVEADALIEFAGAGLARRAIWQADFCRAAFLQDIDDAGLFGIRDRLGGEHHGAIGLAEHLQPFPDLVAEGRMAEHQPGLVENDEAWRTGQALFDAPEEIEKDRHEIALAHVHQFLDLEGLEGAKGEAVRFGVEKLAHRSVDRVVLQRGLDLAHLDAADEIGERTAAGVGHQSDLP